MAHQHRLLRAILLGCCVLLLATFTSCDSVKFYDKRELADGIMAFDDSPTGSHFIAKSIYSREASIGGIGTTAGGGCGCY